MEVDEAHAVDLPLHPGEFSLHHIALVHGSGPNLSSGPRIGVAVRYISPDVVQGAGAERDLVMLVRGKDSYGHFDIVDPQDRDMAFGESKVHAEARNRKLRNLFPKDRVPSKA